MANIYDKQLKSFSKIYLFSIVMTAMLIIVSACSVDYSIQRRPQQPSPNPTTSAENPAPTKTEDQAETSAPAQPPNTETTPPVVVNPPAETAPLPTPAPLPVEELPPPQPPQKEEPPVVVAPPQKEPPVEAPPKAEPPPTEKPPKPALKSKKKLADVSVPKKMVDILFVIDNSKSMNPEQRELGRRFNSFINELDGLDWQIAITTTDVLNKKIGTQGKLLPLVTSFKSLPSQFDPYVIKSKYPKALAQDLFANTIRRPPSEGTKYEQGIRATHMALSRYQQAQSAIRNLIRSEAPSLNVVIISDADETPVQHFLKENKPEAVLNLVHGIWNGKKAFVVHSIIVKSGDKACRHNKFYNNEGYGKSYEEISQKTGGIIGSVCAPDYRQELKQLGIEVAKSIDSITLDCDPQVDADHPMKVYDSAQQPIEFTLKGRKVTLSRQPEDGKVDVDYWCDESEKTEEIR